MLDVVSVQWKCKLRLTYSLYNKLQTFQPCLKLEVMQLMSPYLARHHVMTRDSMAHSNPL